jgi:hypothetical protein
MPQNWKKNKKKRKNLGFFFNGAKNPHNLRQNQAHGQNLLLLFLFPFFPLEGMVPARLLPQLSTHAT